MGRVRFALRSLAKAPLLSAVVVLSLGLGIGANTAIFSLLHQILLRPLPVEKPGELVALTAPGEFVDSGSADTAGGVDSVFTYDALRELQKHTGAVTGVAGFRTIPANLAFQNQTKSGSVTLISGNYFSLLGVPPLAGRMIAAGDDRGAGNPVAVLSYGYWHDTLAGSAAVLGRPLRINGQVFTIVGVAPRGFTGTVLGFDPEAYAPIALKSQVQTGRSATGDESDHWIYLFARLRPGISLQQAQAALNGPYGSLVEQLARTIHNHDDEYIRRFRLSRLTLHDGSRGQSMARDLGRTPLVILMAATALVLLIAMANAANLLLARSAQRRKEMAIRAALGAGRGELMSQLLVEALLLAGAGGIAGLALGSLTLRFLLARLQGNDTPIYYLTPHLDSPVLLFSLAVTASTGLLFGLYPAWEAARASLAATLGAESGRTSATTGSARIRRLLVCAQVTVSAMLLIPTGLFLKSLVNVMHVDLGMNTANVIEFQLAPNLNGYRTPQSRTLFERVETAVAAIPGVRAVAASIVPLIGNSTTGNDVTVDAGSRAPQESAYNIVGPGFFTKMGIPLIAGRDFTERDNLAGPDVAIVNQSFAARFFGGRSPLGHRIGIGAAHPQPAIEIVGLVKDSHYAQVKEQPQSLFYTPWRQEADLGALDFYVRSELPAGAMIPQIRKLLASLDSSLPAQKLQTLDERIRDNVFLDRMVLQLTAAFAVLATALAMLGLYGVMAHSVTRRTREIGIRMALGAGPARIRSMVMREMLWILGIGLAAGIPAALALSRLAQNQLYGVKPFDAVVVAAAAAALAAAAGAAGYSPARRASRVSPLEALRHE